MKRKMISVLALCVVLIGVVCFSAYGQDKGDDLYVIKRGDTLWDLSDEFLKDPYQWPELWQRNQYITNPHLIYPGNLIRLHGRPTRVPGKVLTEEEGAERLSETAKTTEIQGDVEKTSMEAEEAREIRGIEDEDFAQIFRRGRDLHLIIFEEDSLGTIIDARHEKRMLCQGDTVYLAMKERVPEVGERYTIFRATKTMKNPYSKKKARKVYVLGTLEVTATKGALYQAEIMDSFDAIWRGDEVMTFKVLE